MPHTSHSTLQPRTNPLRLTTDDIAFRPFIARATGSKTGCLPRRAIRPVHSTAEASSPPTRPPAPDPPPRPCPGSAPAGASDETGGRGLSDRGLEEEGDEWGMGGGFGGPHIPLTDTC